MSNIKNIISKILLDRISEIDKELKLITESRLLFENEDPDKKLKNNLKKERELCYELNKVVVIFRKSTYYKEDNQNTLMIGKIEISLLKNEWERKFISDLKTKNIMYNNNLLLSTKQKECLLKIYNKMYKKGDNINESDK